VRSHAHHAGVGKLDGVAHEVEQHLGQALLVAQAEGLRGTCLHLVLLGCRSRRTRLAPRQRGSGEGGDISVGGGRARGRSKVCQLVESGCWFVSARLASTNRAAAEPLMSVVIEYYMTLNSPWTYLGSALFAEIASRNRATVNIKPCKFGPIFEQTGGLPLPKRSPQRRAYRMMELKRWRDVRGIPLTLEPKHFPCDDTAATRLVIAAKLRGQDAHRLSLELGRSLWERGEPL